MIRVTRPAASPEILAALDLPLPDGRTELEAARRYYATNPPHPPCYPFKRYRQYAVCKALDELFHGKCAYCESVYRAVDALDIEHYRPKGGVTEDDDHPGYWWLAGVWSNLLPSCPPCNQLRKHTHYRIGATPEEFERE